MKLLSKEPLNKSRTVALWGERCTKGEDENDQFPSHEPEKADGQKSTVPYGLH